MRQGAPACTCRKWLEKWLASHVAPVCILVAIKALLMKIGVLLLMFSDGALAPYKTHVTGNTPGVRIVWRGKPFCLHIGVLLVVFPYKLLI